MATLQYHIRGVDGSLWDIGFGDKVQIRGTGIQGLLDFGPTTKRTRRASGTDGHSRGPVRFEGREGVLPVKINASLPPDLLIDTAAAWWSAWSEDEPSELIVTSPSGEKRTLRLFLDGDGDPVREADPLEGGFDFIDMEVSAPDPWWYGDEVTTPFPPQRENNFYGPNNAGPPFWIRPATVVGATTITNHGYREAWPTWTVIGPSTGFEFAVNGSVVAGPIVVEAGWELELNANPGHKTAFLTNGVERIDVTSQLQSWGFGSIPPGVDVAAVARVDGDGGMATVRFTPRFRKAW